MAENGTLAELLKGYASALAGYQTELTRMAERINSFEIRQAELEAWAVSAGYKRAR